jgi:large subunit ribosomal protein L5
MKNYINTSYTFGVFLGQRSFASQREVSWAKKPFQKISLKKNRSEIFYKQIVCLDYVLKQDVKNIMQIPKISKIILNTTSKSCVTDKKYLIPPLVALQLICGQKLKYTKSKTSIATYKLRKNQLIGCKVSLHGEKMYNFLEKFVNIILPKFREFSGLIDINFDKNGNLTLGIKNLLVFPELENSFELFDFIQGMNITFVTSTNSRDQSKLLFSRLQFPLRVTSLSF